MNIQAISKALDYLADNNVSLPIDLKLKLEEKGLLHSLKKDKEQQPGDMGDVEEKYRDTISGSLSAYFEGGESISKYKGEFKRAVLDAFQNTYNIGWVDGGGDLPIDDEDATSWLDNRINQELGFIDGLFQEAKELRKEEGFDYYDWVEQRSDGYVRMLAEIYNQAKLRAMEDINVTFDGDDGEESCRSCQNLKGKRHKLSWFVKRNYVPPYGIGLDCGRGGHCQHGLYDDKGNLVTYEAS